MALHAVITGWASVAFSVISTIVVITKCFTDYTFLRLGCVIISVFTTLLAILNALRTLNLIEDFMFFGFLVAGLLLFVDLTLAISYNIGARFYTVKESRNFLFWLTLVLFVALNVLGIGGMVTLQGFHQFKLSEIMVLSSELLCVLAMLLGVMYSFMPLVKPIAGRVRPKSGVDIVEVGVWYLGGLTVNLLISLVVLIFSIVYPTENYRDLGITIAAISYILRMIFLVWYSFPPPKSIIRSIRNAIFTQSQSSSPSSSSSSSSRPQYKVAQYKVAADQHEIDQHEMHISSGKKLTDDDSEFTA